MATPKDLKTVVIVLMIVSIGMLIAAAVLRDIGLGGVGAAGLTIAAAVMEKSKPGAFGDE